MDMAQAVNAEHCCYECRWKVPRASSFCTVELGLGWNVGAPAGIGTNSEKLGLNISRAITCGGAPNARSPIRPLGCYDTMKSGTLLHAVRNCTASASHKETIPLSGAAAW